MVLRLARPVTRCARGRATRSPTDHPAHSGRHLRQRPTVPSLDLDGTVGTHSTPPTRSSAGGWCVRVDLGYKPKGHQYDPPRVVTIHLKGTYGLKQTGYARLQTNKGGSASAAGVPRAQSGCHKSNSGGPG